MSSEDRDPTQELMDEILEAELASAAEAIVNEEEMDEGLPAVMPLMPIRGNVMFPGTVMPLTIGREKSRELLEDALPKEKVICLVTQRDEEVEDPQPSDLYEVGAAVNVLKMIKQADGDVVIIVHGLDRVLIDAYVQSDPYYRVSAHSIEEIEGHGKGFTAAVNQLREQAKELIQLTPNVPDQALQALLNIEDPSGLADFLAANLNLDLQEKQDLLEEADIGKRIRSVHRHISAQLEIAKLQQKIQEDVQESISDAQRKIFLREQMKAIQRELGEDMEGAEVIDELKQRIEAANPPEIVMKEVDRELSRLEAVPAASPEYSVILNYLELIADLPWCKTSSDNLDLSAAKGILDRDHFGLEKIKKRLIEYLAIRKLNPESKGTILCLAGPPGVGKTSLGRSIAEALGRQFARLSLGGIRDEAEIRGHRRTYIGAMPGRIIQELRRAGTNNPVMMLDELDKLGSDFRGDPASALLEVLDPRQNSTFSDRFLDVPFDLSKVIFLATANYLDAVPHALLDRLEVLEIPGYTDHDKLQIAKRYLVPRQLDEHGLPRGFCRWSMDAIRVTIDEYTREAGVRELERKIGSVCRGIAAEVAAEVDLSSLIDAEHEDERSNKVGKKAAKKASKKAAKKVVKKSKKKAAKKAARKKVLKSEVKGAEPRAVKKEEEPKLYDDKQLKQMVKRQRSAVKLEIAKLEPIKVTPEIVRQHLGPTRYEREVDERSKMPGVVVGLAYTAVGGDILFIESTAYPGNGKLQLTGQLGDVMKESVGAALSLFKAHAHEFNFDVKKLNELDLHVHVPAGAVPKDGPSAGCAMFTSIVSLLLNLSVKESLAMTGEITLRGQVLPIGGVKEKTLAAVRAGIKTVLLPEKNRKDLEEIDPEVKKKLKIEFVATAGDVLDKAIGLSRIHDASKKMAKQKESTDSRSHVMPILGHMAKA